jgi:hypothetical protein
VIFAFNTDTNRKKTTADSSSPHYLLIFPNKKVSRRREMKKE